jgi:hypothetical protein
LCQIFLEWSLATQFTASNDFIKKWADAQKFVYGMGAGWIVSHLFLFFSPQLKISTNDFFLTLYLVLELQNRGFCGSSSI